MCEKRSLWKEKSSSIRVHVKKEALKTPKLPNQVS
jgi:hypothetical protein